MADARRHHEDLPELFCPESDTFMKPLHMVFGCDPPRMWQKVWVAQKKERPNAIIWVKTTEHYTLYHMDADVGHALIGVEYDEGSLAAVRVGHSNFQDLVSRLAREGYENIVVYDL